MSLTELELSICNQALAMIGQKQISYTDTTTADTGTAGNPYKKCDLFYEQTRNALQRCFEWNFATARLELVDTWATGTAYTTDQYVFDASDTSVLYKCTTAHTSTTWNTDYVYDGTELVYDGTSQVRENTITFYWDMITDRPETYWTYRFSLPSDFIRFKNKWLKHNDIHFAIEGKSILTDETELDINYIKKVTDTTLFDDLFIEVLIYDLAIKLTFALCGSGYTTQKMRNDLTVHRQRIMMKARQVSFTEANRTGEYTWSSARYGSGIV